MEFRDCLGEELRAKLDQPLESSEWKLWTNTPDPRRRGVRLEELDEAQGQKANALLEALLSPAGWKKVLGIMRADDQLRGSNFGSDKFWFLFFGEPSRKEPWGLQFEGHHLILNFVFREGRACMSPTFLGIEPAVYEVDSTTVEPMRSEISLAFDLLESLTEEQRSAAVRSPQIGQLQAGAGSDGVVPTRHGVPAEALTEAQRGLLLALIREWLGVLPADLARERIEAVTAELPEVRFSWSGPTERGRAISYRIQGPTLLIELAHQNRIGGPPSRSGDYTQHVHSVYRDLQNDYGAVYRAH